MIEGYIREADGTIRPEPDLLVWAEWYETGDRIIAQTETRDAHISTVFLGLDHSFGLFPDEPPVLWETMIFGGVMDGEFQRYQSEEEARKWHQVWVDVVREMEVADATRS